MIFKNNFFSSVKNFNCEWNIKSLITFLWRVDKVCSAITFSNVKKKHKKKTKFRQILFLSYKNIFTFYGLIWIL